MDKAEQKQQMSISRQKLAGNSSRIEMAFTTKSRKEKWSRKIGTCWTFAYECFTSGYRMICSWAFIQGKKKKK